MKIQFILMSAGVSRAVVIGGYKGDKPPSTTFILLKRSMIFSVFDHFQSCTSWTCRKRGPETPIAAKCDVSPNISSARNLRARHLCSLLLFWPLEKISIRKTSVCDEIHAILSDASTFFLLKAGNLARLSSQILPDSRRHLLMFWRVGPYRLNALTK